MDVEFWKSIDFEFSNQTHGQQKIIPLYINLIELNKISGGTISETRVVSNLGTTQWTCCFLIKPKIEMIEISLSI